MHAVTDDIANDDVIVKLGEIGIHEPDLIVQYLGVEIWEIDCVSKYPDAFMVEDEEGVGVDLVASPETLKIDESKKGVHTSIRFPGTDGWHIMVEALRYTVRIVIWKDRRNG